MFILVVVLKLTNVRCSTTPIFDWCSPMVICMHACMLALMFALVKFLSNVKLSRIFDKTTVTESLKSLLGRFTTIFREIEIDEIFSLNCYVVLCLIFWFFLIK